MSPNDRGARADGDYSLVSVDAAIEHLADFDAVIDVRSESEYADDHLPGAINCPVLDDAQRAEVGTLYTQVAPFEARRRGAALVSRNIAQHIETRFADAPRSWRPLVYCWRGGERSAALTLVMLRVGWRARRLEGGYRAYRRKVLAELELLPTRFDLRVLCGPTGSGKSRLLGALARAGGQVLDLEQLGAHRGSVLGDMPDAPQPSQKQFESRIWSALRAADPGQVLYVESESRRLGRLQLPDALLAAMRSAPCVRIELGLEQRVALLRDEYRHLELAPALLASQLERLLALHGRERVQQWQQRARQADWTELVGELLEQHYDPAYKRSIGHHFERLAQARVLKIDGADGFDAAAHELLAEAAAGASS